MKFFKKGQLIFLFLIMILISGCDELTNSTTTTQGVSGSTTTTFDDQTTTSDPAITTTTADEPTLIRPTNLIITNDLLTWSNVAEANQYIIFIDGEDHTTVNTNQFDLSTLNLGEGDYVITIIATNGVHESNPSYPITYYVVDDQFLAEILVEFDPTYVLNMTTSDFLTPDDYQTYTEVLAFATTYATAMVNEGITHENALNIIRNLKNLDTQLNGVQDVTEAKAIIDEIFAGTGLDSNKVANIMVDLAQVLIKIAITHETDEGIIDQLNAFDQVLTYQRSTFIDGIVSVTNYAMRVYGHFDESFVEDLNNLITNNLITTEEIFIIKDEIVSVLDETLPSIEDYENVYTVYMLVYNLFNHNTTTVDTDFITSLATITQQSDQLMIYFIDAVDLQTYTDVETIVNEMYVPGYEIYNPETGYYEWVAAQFDINKMVELILYIDPFINDFKTTHQTIFDNIEEIQTEEFKYKIYDWYEQLIISSLEESLVEPQLSMTVTMIEKIFDNIHIYEDAFEVYDRLGTSAYDHFIQTEGKFVIDYYNLMTEISNGADPFVLATEIQSVFSQYMEYENITVGSLTQEDFTKIVHAMLFTSQFTIIQRGVPIEDVEPLVTQLTPVIADIIYPYLQFETSLMNNLDQNQAILDVLDPNSTINLDESIFRELVLALNDTLTTEMRENLQVSAESVFDDVLSNATIMQYTQMTGNEIDQIKSTVLQEMDVFFNLVELVAGYDFDNMTTEQQQNYQALYDMIMSVFQPSETELREAFAHEATLFAETAYDYALNEYYLGNYTTGVLEVTVSQLVAEYYLSDTEFATYTGTIKFEIQDNNVVMTSLYFEDATYLIYKTAPIDYNFTISDVVLKADI